MRIDLKCGEYLNFHKIRRVEILDNDIIKIKGNPEERKRSVTYQTHLQAIKNIRELNRFLKNEMKVFQADGACEYCGSLNVEEQGQTMYRRKLNEPKEKNKYDRHAVAGYRCNSCNKLFSELKLVDLIIYYK